jgi:hypothetical protein
MEVISKDAQFPFSFQEQNINLEYARTCLLVVSRKI